MMWIVITRNSRCSLEDIFNCSQTNAIGLQGPLALGDQAMPSAAALLDRNLMDEVWCALADSPAL